MWMIYGANGYTGELIAREAVRRGHKPMLAGRNGDAIVKLAKELDCPSRVFDLAQPDLSGVSAVLHCAGPFLHTSRPMVQACLDAGAHYLDITGEIGVFEAVFRRDEEARKKGLALIPGVGFDVVPTDCLAAALHEKMPDAVELWLAFAPRGGGISRGTLKTAIEGMALGSAIRKDGRLVKVPQAFDVREIPYPSRPLLSMTIPWGDLATAYRTTGIPNIRVYSARSPKSIRSIRRWRSFLPLLKITLLRRAVLAWANRHTGPTEEQRTTGRVELCGRVANARGEEATMTKIVSEGYAFTARSAVSAVERLLASPSLSGALTPAVAFGKDFVDEV